MAYRLTFEILLSESALIAIKEFNLNIPEIAITNIHAEIMKHIELKDNLSQITLQRQNIELKESLKALEEENLALIKKLEERINDINKTKNLALLKHFKAFYKT